MPSFAVEERRSRNQDPELTDGVVTGGVCAGDHAMKEQDDTNAVAAERPSADVLAHEELRCDVLIACRPRPVVQNAYDTSVHA